MGILESKESNISNGKEEMEEEIYKMLELWNMNLYQIKKET